MEQQKEKRARRIDIIRIIIADWFVYIAFNIYPNNSNDKISLGRYMKG